MSIADSDPPDLLTDPEELEKALLGGPQRWNRRELSRSAGVSMLSARKLWRALGFPWVDDDEITFTDEDVHALERAVAAVRYELLDEETTIAFARALGHTTDRLVSWQVEALMDHLGRCPHPDCSQGRAAGAAAHLAPVLSDLEALLVYTWRRKLAAALRRIEPTDGDVGSGSLAVGFADLVSYTSLSHRLSQRDLGVLVQRFEALASDVITVGGGRLIKTVGDEVLFTADTPQSAAVIGLSISEQMGIDPMLPDVRVGIAYGPVLRSLGDVYGPTVNLASRLTAIASPGTVITDPSTATALQDTALVLVGQRRRRVRGFGSVQPLLITRGEDPLIDLD